MSSCAFALIAIAICVPGAALYGAQAVTPTPALPVPHNLKVLPKEISAVELNRVMQRYTEALGVPCGYCHAEGAEGKLDYASDDNPIKGSARFMINMTREINEKYLSQLGDRRYADPITCGNCHLGAPHPPTFAPKSH